MTSGASNLSVTAAGFGVLVVVAGALWFGVGRTVPPPAVSDRVTVHAESKPNGFVAVHVSGAVAVPGVVTVSEGSRIADIVIAAGGATRDADLNRVNLAALVRDGEHVVIPSISPVALGGAPPDERFDLNTADALGFESLPGIGPVLASRIVDYREANGPFESVEDLLDVPGIGESKLVGIRDALDDP